MNGVDVKWLFLLCNHFSENRWVRMKKGIVFNRAYLKVIEIHVPYLMRRCIHMV